MKNHGPISVNLPTKKHNNVLDDVQKGAHSLTIAIGLSFKVSDCHVKPQSNEPVVVLEALGFSVVHPEFKEDLIEETFAIRVP